MIKVIYKILIICGFVLFQLQSSYLVAQEIKKDVTVLKPYQPVVQDAGKINQMPVFNDTSSISTEFEYFINPIKINTTFQPRPVPSATMAPETVQELHNNYVKLGIGNPFAPLVEVSVNNGRSKENAYGVFLHHQSADGKVKLDNNNETEVDAPYSDNSIELFGKHLFKHSVINGKVGYSSNKFVYYGYEPSLQPVFNLDSNTQKYQVASAEIALNQLKIDSNKLSYNATSKFDYLSDLFNHTENHILIAGQFKKQIKEFYAGTDLSFNYFLPGGSNNSSHDGIFILKPYLSKSKKEWRVTFGVNVTFDNTEEGTTLYPYPFANFEFTIAPQVLNAFINYDGQLEVNSLSNLIQKNPLINASIEAKNSNYKTRISAGLKGNLSAKSQFVATVYYSDIKDQILFINDTINWPFNTFLPVYDDIELLKVKAEAMFKAFEKIDLSLAASFNNYSMMKQAQPWNLPIFDASAVIRYNIQNKIISTTNIFLIGQRYARNPITGKTITLNTFADINETIEYRYTKLFSIFLQIKNLTASKYQYWNQYSSYRFQIMGGITYIF
jgi:hypothetical protein